MSEPFRFSGKVISLEDRFKKRNKKLPPEASSACEIISLNVERNNSKNDKNQNNEDGLDELELEHPEIA